MSLHEKGPPTHDPLRHDFVALRAACARVRVVNGAHRGAWAPRWISAMDESSRSPRPVTAGQSSPPPKGSDPDRCSAAARNADRCSC